MTASTGAQTTSGVTTPTTDEPATAAPIPGWPDGVIIDFELEYDNRARWPHFPEYFRAWREGSARLRAAGGRLDVSYGPDPGQRVDLFGDGPTRLVFFHGGYWRALDKDDFSWVAGPLVAAGLSVAVVNYDLCPAVTLGRQVEQCREVIDWLARDSSGEQIVAGHSAGGHQVAMLLATDWAGRGHARDPIAGAISLSGLFELAPLARTAMNADLRIDDAVAAGLSPARLPRRSAAPLVLAVGEQESSEFHRQSAALARAWGEPDGVLSVAGANHFDVLDALTDLSGELWRRARARRHSSPDR
ncbi:MAG: alpha/beta hydrolase, partial [Myxococcales bacterium]